MTWNELHETIPEERRNDQVHILDEDHSALDWGNISLRTVGSIVEDGGVSYPQTMADTLLPEQFVLVFES